MSFLIHQAIAVVIRADCWVDTERHDVLMMGCEDAGMDNGAKVDSHAFVNGRGGEYSGSSHFVFQLASLVEDESKDISGSMSQIQQTRRTGGELTRNWTQSRWFAGPAVDFS